MTLVLIFLDAIPILNLIFILLGIVLNLVSYGPLFFKEFGKTRVLICILFIIQIGMIGLTLTSVIQRIRRLVLQ